MIPANLQRNLKALVQSPQWESLKELVRLLDEEQKSNMRIGKTIEEIAIETLHRQGRCEGMVLLVQHAERIALTQDNGAH